MSFADSVKRESPTTTVNEDNKMCHFNDDCNDVESYWEGETTHTGGASLTPFGCEACGYEDCL